MLKAPIKTVLNNAFYSRLNMHFIEFLLAISGQNKILVFLNKLITSKCFSTRLQKLVLY